MNDPASIPEKPESDPDPQHPVPGSPDKEGSDAEGSDPGLAHLAPPNQVAEKVDSSQIAHFVVTIKNAEQQVGEHIIKALQYPDTVAVLTTVVMSPDGQQRVISAALNATRLQQVQEILDAAGQEREEEEPCVGFHCLVKPRAKQQESES